MDDVRVPSLTTWTGDNTGNYWHKVSLRPYNAQPQRTGSQLSQLDRNVKVNMEREPDIALKQLFADDWAHPNEVDWDGPNDIHNPRNWSIWTRGTIVGMVTSIVFST